MSPLVTLEPASENIRYRHLVKDGRHFYLLFNEESSPVTVKLDLTVNGQRLWLNPVTAAETSAAADETVVFAPYELKVVSLDQTR